MRLARVLLALAVAATSTAFEQARSGYVFEFPRDYFEHPEFQAEWWYYTGNLATPEGRPFGFELTFFRVSLTPDLEVRGAWELDQVYVAHFVLTDIETGRMHKRERTNRGGPGIAGASEANRTVWNGNWSVEYLAEDRFKPTQRMWAGHDGATLSLSLVPAKPVVVHGENGISRKGGGEGQASHYLSFTRLVASGTVEVDGTKHEVEGAAWMDHEFFTNSLSGDLVGWDWMSIQLSDGTDLMLYGLRDANGRHGEFSSGTFVGTDGQVMHLTSKDVRLTPGRTWSSEESGARYPVEWAVEVPVLDLRLEVRPLLDAQEVTSDRGYLPVYWEGAVTYSGQRIDRPVEGRGYLEMTGYDKPFDLSAPGRLGAQ